MARPLEGKTALVTGGARGIGRAVCRRLAAAGCQVCINYYNSSDEAESLRAELEAGGVRAQALQANVADAESVRELIAAFRNEFDHLDILVSNAASGVLRPALEMTTKHWRWCLETNALALNHVLREAKPLLRRGARVLALSSLGSRRAIPDYAFIGASKAALESLVRALSLELVLQHRRRGRRDIVWRVGAQQDHVHLLRANAGRVQCLLRRPQGDIRSRPIAGCVPAAADAAAFLKGVHHLGQLGIGRAHPLLERLVGHLDLGHIAPCANNRRKACHPFPSWQPAIN